MAIAPHRIAASIKNRCSLRSEQTNFRPSSNLHIDLNQKQACTRRRARTHRARGSRAPLRAAG
jgi:hypothetical protein